MSDTKRSKDEILKMSTFPTGPWVQAEQSRAVCSSELPKIKNLSTSHLRSIRSSPITLHNSQCFCTCSREAQVVEAKVEYRFK